MRILLKIGGSGLEQTEARSAFCRSVAAARRAGHEIAIVHGGGNQIREMCRRLSIEQRYHDGLRVTDEQTAEVVLMVLSGLVNGTLVADLERAGVPAVGISGADGGTFSARRLNKAGIDLGFVGAIEKTDPSLCDLLLSSGRVPVIATVAPGPEAGGPFLNVNADHAAGPLCRALGCDAVLFLSDVEGVVGAEGQRIEHLAPEECSLLAKSGVIRGGMLPKIEAALLALSECPEAIVKIGKSGEDCVLRLLDPGEGTEFADQNRGERPREREGASWTKD
ncbi:MAG: acetylglutamate kinase [Planctomycetota bacterium]